MSCLAWIRARVPASRLPVQILDRAYLRSFLRFVVGAWPQFLLKPPDHALLDVPNLRPAMKLRIPDLTIARRPLRSTCLAALLSLALLPRARAQEFDTWLGYDTAVYPQAFFPQDMEVADLDGDGFADVIAVNGNVASVSVLRNRRGKGFDQPVHYPTAQAMYGFEVCDVDLDGDLDVITADSGSVWQGTTVSIMRNDGSGQFAAPVPYAALKGPAGLLADDFDGDGRPDLVVTGWDRSFGDEIALLRNDGSGGFLAPELFTVAGGPVGSGPYDVASGDLDGDGAPELIVGRAGGYMSVLRNTGGSFGAFQQHTIHNIPLAGDFFPSVHVEDSDHDGDLDIFYTSSMTVMGSDTSYGAMVVLLNDGAGNLTTVQRHPLVDLLGGGSDSHLADLNADGWLDVLTVHRSAGGWTYMHADGQGGFFEGTEIPGGEGPIAIRGADANGDGHQDVLVLSWESLELTVHENDGQGDFQVHHGTPVTGLASDMDLADIDGDGDLDAATSSGYAGSGTVGVLRNDGSGHFSPPTEEGAGTAAMAVKFRDLDGDGWPDLLWADHPTSFPYDFWTAPK